MNPDWKSQKEFWRTWAGAIAEEEGLAVEVISTYDTSTTSADESWTYNQFKSEAVHALWEWDI